MDAVLQEQYLLDTNQDSEMQIEVMSKEARLIIDDLSPSDRLLWDAYEKCGYKLTKLEVYMLSQRRTKLPGGAVSRTSLSNQLTRIKKYISGRIKGACRKYTAAVIVEFWSAGDTDEVLAQIEAIESAVAGPLANLKNGKMVETRLA